jgi:hypothetical protein
MRPHEGLLSFRWEESGPHLKELAGVRAREEPRLSEGLRGGKPKPESQSPQVNIVAILLLIHATELASFVLLSEGLVDVLINRVDHSLYVTILAESALIARQRKAEEPDAFVSLLLEGEHRTRSYSCMASFRQA